MGSSTVPGLSVPFRPGPLPRFWLLCRMEGLFSWWQRSCCFLGRGDDRVSETTRFPCHHLSPGSSFIPSANTGWRPAASQPGLGAGWTKQRGRYTAVMFTVWGAGPPANTQGNRRRVGWVLCRRGAASLCARWERSLVSCGLHPVEASQGWKTRATARTLGLGRGTLSSGNWELGRGGTRSHQALSKIKGDSQEQGKALEKFWGEKWLGEICAGREDSPCWSVNRWMSCEGAPLGGTHWF